MKRKYTKSDKWYSVFLYRHEPRPERRSGETVYCEVCNKQFYLPKYRLELGSRFCSSKCKGLGFIGISASPETQIKSGQRLSPETEFKKGQTVGANNANWRGGTTKFRSRLYHTEKYGVWRKSVFERDSYTCQICNKVGGKVEADHITMLSLLVARYGIKSIAEALECDAIWDLNNGQTLCKKCHRTKTNNELRVFWSNQTRPVPQT